MSATTPHTAGHAAADPVSHRRWNKAVWAVQIMLAVFFVTASFAKLSGQHSAVEQFTKIGLGQWLRYLAGVCELSGGLGLLIPRLAGAAATGLVGLMIGATIVNLLAVGPAIAAATTVLAIAFAAIARYRWNEPSSLTSRLTP